MSRFALLVLLLAGGPASAADSAGRAKEIFRTHCAECHSGPKARAGVNVLDRDGLIKKEKVVPGKPDDSTLYQLVTATDESAMPPTGRPRLTAEQTEVIRKWIAAGAPPFPADAAAPPEPAREKDKPLKDLAGVDYVLKKILAHVRVVPAGDRPFLRYFSINHVLTAGATAARLADHRHALAKAINHLSREPKLVRPKSIDSPVDTVFAIDIREVGWHRKPFKTNAGDKEVPGELTVFDLALLEYPYAIAFADSDTFDRLAEEFLAPANQVRPVPYLRADWFSSVVTQPPLYEDFLQLPFTLTELEKELGVDAESDLADRTALRAGMTVSGVSRNNRVVERHGGRTGMYWKSFDFRTSKGPENVMKDPITFKPSGGEMIFRLPNGLQGYYVADGRGQRLDAAPTDIVVDKFAADKTVRNGLGCIRCHDQGIKEFVDTVRPAVEALPGIPGFDRRTVLDLYPPQEKLDTLVKTDRSVFQSGDDDPSRPGSGSRATGAGDDRVLGRPDQHLGRSRGAGAGRRGEAGRHLPDAAVHRAGTGPLGRRRRGAPRRLGRQLRPGRPGPWPRHSARGHRRRAPTRPFGRLSRRGDRAEDEQAEQPVRAGRRTGGERDQQVGQVGPH